MLMNRCGQNRLLAELRRNPSPFRERMDRRSAAGPLPFRGTGGMFVGGIEALDRCVLRVRRHSMYRRLISLSVPGLPILSGIAVAIALMSSQPLVRAANSSVTIGGPVTLTSPDRTTV